MKVDEYTGIHLLLDWKMLSVFDTKPNASTFLSNSQSAGSLMVSPEMPAVIVGFCWSESSRELIVVGLLLLSPEFVSSSMSTAQNPFSKFFSIVAAVVYDR